MGAEAEARYGESLLDADDVWWFKEGNQFTLYDKLGAHLVRRGGRDGVIFAVWAPNADAVSVIGDFNDWRPHAHPLRVRDDGSGIWEAFVPAVERGARYKFHVARGDYAIDKGDPFAARWEAPPATASVVWDRDYEWGDAEWMRERAGRNALDAPWAIYEVHLGSWARVPEEGGRSLTYREIAPRLADYAAEMGFTHVEIMPVMEHPFYGSWGYQITGYFAPTARYGTPQDFMYLVDHLHQRGIGVILDWVPSHFPSDGHGLCYFDGTYLFEHQDPKRGYHPEWRSYIFNYGRNEVRAFLVSSARMWLDVFHADGLRVDGVASMLYLDYAREPGEWIPNAHGGNEDLEAIAFLRRLNEAVYEAQPGEVHTVAEESTSWPMVSRPTHVGGLGFGMKWNMGWMHDTLAYFAEDPIHRKYHHEKLTFSIWYAFTENFVLPLSHDEVVHGKGSLVGKMPGDEWQKFANLRALLGLMYTHPGKKMLFMGGEFGQWREWNHDASLDWDLLERPLHAGLSRWVRDLNTLYRAEPALHALDFSAEGFEWVDFHDYEESVITFLRRAPDGESVLVACNLTPSPRHNYIVGVPRAGRWREILNGDAPLYGGSGMGNLGGVDSAPVAAQGHYHSLVLTLPPLSVSAFKREAAGETRR